MGLKPVSVKIAVMDSAGEQKEREAVMEIAPPHRGGLTYLTVDILAGQHILSFIGSRETVFKLNDGAAIYSGCTLAGMGNPARIKFSMVQLL